MIGLLIAGLIGRGRRWESICRRCGTCCYEKVGGTVDWSRPCRWLDPRSRLCTVYAERFERCPECRRMTLRHAMFTTWLPDSCGYVQAFRRPRRLLAPRRRAAL